MNPEPGARTWNLEPGTRNRTDAVLRALPRLYEASLNSATFDEYGGHLLLALSLIATTSGDAPICDTARNMALERASYWRQRWPELRVVLNSDNVMQAVIGLFACERLGLTHDDIREDLQRVIVTYEPASLAYFDPSAESIPGDIPQDCRCGQVNVRRANTCSKCGAGLEFLSRYEIWYYALTTAYFCQHCRLDCSIRFTDVLQRVTELRPYPVPGERGLYHAIYAATHIIYTLNGYGTHLLSSDWLPDEFSFLRGSVDWAIAQAEADTLGELVDSLSALGIPDNDRQLTTARRVILESQLPDGTWGDEGGDRYAYFHTLWAAIDGLRGHAWRGEAVLSPELRQTLARLKTRSSSA